MIPSIVAREFPCDSVCDAVLKARPGYGHSVFCPVTFRPAATRACQAVMDAARVCGNCGGKPMIRDEWTEPDGSLGMSDWRRCEVCSGRGVVFDGGAK